VLFPILTVSHVVLVMVGYAGLIAANAWLMFIRPA
jgi:hypothetical protein